MNNSIKLLYLIIYSFIVYDGWWSMYMNIIISRFSQRRLEEAWRNTSDFEEFLIIYDSQKQEYDLKVNSFKILANGSYLILIMIVGKIIF